MVKGVSKRIVVVKSPDGKFFEEAIFIVRDGVTENGVSADDIMTEACAIANRYIRRAPTRKRVIPQLRWLRPAVVGAGVTGVLWLVSTFVL